MIIGQKNTAAQVSKSSTQKAPTKKKTVEENEVKDRIEISGQDTTEEEQDSSYDGKRAHFKPSDKLIRDRQRKNMATLKFIHMNDTLGYVAGFSHPVEKGIKGGSDRALTEIKKLRERNPEGTIVMDAGDIYSGGFYSKLTEGKIVSDAYKEMGVEVGVIGNHDLSWGLEKYAEIAKGTGAEFLGANLTDISSAQHLKFLKPYTVIERKGVKIGVLGITTPITELVARGQVEVEDPRRTTKKYIDEMKSKDKVDMVVVLSHLGHDKDVELAQQTKGIDVIVGAHSKTLTEKPTEVNGTYIVQAGGEGKYLGNLDIQFDTKEKKIISAREHIIPLTKDIKADPAMKKILMPYLKKYKQLNDEVVGKTNSALPLIHDKRTKLNSFFANAQKIDSDVSLTSSISIRRGINRGNITYGELFNMYPYDNELVQVKAHGKDLLNYLEADLQFMGAKDEAEALLSDNFSYEWNPELIDGSKITAVNFNGKKMSRKDFEKLTLTISMDDYTQGKEFFRLNPVQKKYGRVFEQLAQYVEENPGLSNLEEGTKSFRVSDVPDRDLLAHIVLGKISKKEPSEPSEEKFTCASKFYADAIKSEGKADVSFGLNSYLRAPLPEGDVTPDQLKEVYPFQNNLVLSKVTGTDLLLFLEYARQDRFKGTESITSSGISYEYDNSLPEGKRIISVKIGEKTYTKDELTKEKDITVAMDYFLHQVKFTTSPIVEEKGSVFQALGDYLQKNMTLDVSNFKTPGTDISSKK